MDYACAKDAIVTDHSQNGACCHWVISELVVVLLDLNRSGNLSGNFGMRRGPRRYIAR